MDTFWHRPGGTVSLGGRVVAPVASPGGSILLRKTSACWDKDLTAVFSLAQSQTQSQGFLLLQQNPTCFLKPSDGGGEMERGTGDRSGRSWRFVTYPAVIPKVKMKGQFTITRLTAFCWEGPACGQATCSLEFIICRTKFLPLAYW